MLGSVLLRSLLGQKPLRSPWLHQVQKRPHYPSITTDTQADIVVVGAGIAGIMTTYHILTLTDRSVLLLEADKVAHGATGHNAGQVVSYFERQLADLVHEFGEEQTASAQRAIDSAWDLLHEIYIRAGLQTPLLECTGYAGCQDLEEILLHLENNVFSSAHALVPEPLFIAQESSLLSRIPSRFEGFYTAVPHQQILDLLQTEDRRYVAALSAKKGCVNSALLCEELLAYLLQTFPDRLRTAEHSPMRVLDLHETQAIVQVHHNKITATDVVLCTNGFEQFTIHNHAGKDINTKFHHLVNGVIGYMAGYLDPVDREAVAISYLPHRSSTGNPQFDTNPYFYFTRRPFPGPNGTTQSLICIGGPEKPISNTHTYRRTHPYLQEALDVIDQFVRQTYKYAPATISYLYRWHGLMGYTPNGVRCIGKEPYNNHLLYNLGCNGIGILPSIYGGKRIAQLLAGQSLPPSIFDPRES